MVVVFETAVYSLIRREGILLLFLECNQCVQDEGTLDEYSHGVDDGELLRERIFRTRMSLLFLKMLHSKCCLPVGM